MRGWGAGPAPAPDQELAAALTAAAAVALELGLGPVRVTALRRADGPGVPLWALAGRSAQAAARRSVQLRPSMAR